jgi:catechol 2,3-dioxygenase-like lactoylglutathione lyase family enzyme
MLMIDHIGFPASDYTRAKAFYAKALASLGYNSLAMEVTQERPATTPRPALAPTANRISGSAAKAD